MCMSERELKALKDKPLLEMYKRAVELRIKDNGNGKSPFDENQLEQEILERMSKLATSPENREGLLWDGPY